MDPRDRADALLSRARARGAFVVTPDDATSPMDAANTQQIPRAVVNDIDAQDPDSTTKVSAATIEANDHHLASAEPTSRLEPPRGHRPTRPMPVPSLFEEQPAEPVIEEQDVGGLIPTTTQTKRSNLSRRLDGI
ncbi:hypothetical protein [Amycolatopsis albispora]|uniref:Uncharacterized protein n=1 Tax=Amycolatopsis albispora TaxID=1804986 RepID=A0A344LGB7_9PSEU|nr:hypothetical protein [Amycolatopsis albispora]AXB47091.1 hypothetical protein A4R43_35455 [Amycolatopsis albispora]